MLVGSEKSRAEDVAINSGMSFREYAEPNNSLQLAYLPDYAVVDLTTPPIRDGRERLSPPVSSRRAGGFSPMTDSNRLPSRRAFLARAGALFAVPGTLVKAAPLQQVPAFEAASVKPLRVVDGSPKQVVPRMVDPKRFRAREQAQRLVEWAFDMRDFQIVGGPPWIRDGSLRFEIHATAEKPSTDAEAKTMLRALLADRFQLKWHSGSREMSVYALVAGKSGPKN
jgi:hypothetical protein